MAIENIRLLIHTSPETIARHSDGILEYRHQKPWTIRWHDGTYIDWSGFPKQSPDIMEAVPILHADSQVISTIRTCAVVVRPASILIVSPGPNRDEVYWDEFSEGQHSLHHASTFELEDGEIIHAKGFARMNLSRTLKTIGGVPLYTS